MQLGALKIPAFLPKRAQGYTIDTLSYIFPFFNNFFIEFHKISAGKEWRSGGWAAKTTVNKGNKIFVNFILYFENKML